MSRLLRHIPNALTCCNLLCGCFGIVMVLSFGISWPATEADSVKESAGIGGCFILAGAVFDFLDGMAARLLNAYSPTGKQLDSLADMVTFGVLPSFILFQLIAVSTPIDVPDNFFVVFTDDFIVRRVVPHFIWCSLSFFIAIFSALRLAKFNIDTRQADQFIGLPTPANALVVASLPFMLRSHPALTPYILNPITLSIYIVVISGLLVAELPLFALKFRHFRWSGNELRYGFLAASTGLLVMFQLAAVPLIVAFYVLLSVVFNERMAPADHS